jgi:hypothetical protein
VPFFSFFLRSFSGSEGHRIERERERGESKGKDEGPGVDILLVCFFSFSVGEGGFGGMWGTTTPPVYRTMSP